MKNIFLISLLVLFCSGTGLKSQTVNFTKTNVTCNGADDGTLTATITGGTSTYYYVYYKTFLPSVADSFGPTTTLNHTFTSLEPDYYTIYVRDVVTQNVLDFNTIQITQPAVLNATVNSTPVTCFGGSTGSISITSPSGGSGVYDYSITGGASWQTSGNYTGLPAGTYIVMIRDRNVPGCTLTLNGGLVISQLPQLTATVNSTNITCFGLSNGTIVISSPSGGSGSYQYSRNGTTWQSGLTFSGLAPGTYNVLMRDATYTTCSVTLATVTIGQPAQLTASDIAIVKGLTCNESSDGQLQAIVSGGTIPYSYSWYIYSGGTYVPIGQTGQIATGLAQGRYQVRVNDANSCGPSNAVEYFMTGFTDSIPPVFYFDSASVTNTCAGQSNGSITIYAHGGKTPYSYSITTGGASGYQSSSTFSNLSPGNYPPWAMDNKGCKKNGATVRVGTTPNSPVNVSITASPSGSFCPGTSVLFTATPVNGGTSPAYQWRLNGASVGSGGPTYTNASLVNGDQVNVILTSSLRCTIGNPATSNTITASLYIPPSVITQPASIAQCEGTNATFTVVAAGTGLTYQWRKAGVAIPGATNPSYTITGITPANAGNYDVVITGTCGTVTSNTVTLTVNTAPVITTQPVSTSACVGNSATFTVAATGTGLTYQWRKGGAAIPGATGTSYTISSVAAGDAGNYSVVITGTCGTVTSNTVTLTVNTAPVITTQPSSVTQCAGTNATFTVVATGTGLTYQWRKTGVAIPGATGSSYTITGITTANAGNYDVVITGTCGTVTSNTVSLTVNTAPAITTQPVSASACVGNSATFTVVATGTGLTYQWRKSSIAIPGATGTSYTISSVALGDAGNYDVVITGTCGTMTSNTVTLTVNTAPVITSQPSNITQCAGTNATFTVVATGTGLTYQWRKTGVAIPGANGASYTITGITTASAGNYDVVITGTCGSVTSNTVTLTVNTAPVITAQPISVTQCAGTNATFTVAATGTGLTYQWRKGGVAIPGATGPSYTITGITIAHAGNYDVVITGTCGTVTSNTVTLTVNTAPVITTQPSNITQCAGTNATFTVVATGTGLTYQWRKGGVAIPGATGTSYTITGITVANAGNYDVVITGTCGTVTSNTVTLTVNTAPVITTQPVSVAQCAGTNVTFSVVATGPGLTYQWRKGGVIIPGATGPGYTLNNITAGDAGNYDVVITGTCGTVTSNTVTLTVNTAPVITTQPANIVQCEGTNATFTVVAAGTSLTYQWRKGGIAIPGATGSIYTITGITTAHTGNYDVVITGTCGTLTSNTVTLTVNTAPVITTQPVNIAQCEGTNVVFTVAAAGTGLTYQWRKGGVAIPGATGVSYAISNINTGNAGNYDVVITGTCGTVTSNTVTLTVNTAPVITAQPVSVTQCAGTNVVFTVVANGTGLTYQWRKNGLVIGGATNASLTLTGITPSSAGSYDVVITGTCGSAISNGAVLTVAENPAIVFHPSDNEACEGSDVTFTVTATGTNITYQWRKDGTNLAGETSPSVTLPSVSPSDAGQYDVVVYGLCDTIISNKATLTVDPATAADIIDNDTLVCAGSTVEFNVATAGYGSISYQWQWYYGGNWINLNDDTEISGTTTDALTIQNIEAMDTGYYRCAVTSGCGTVNSDSVKLDVNLIVATVGTPAPFLINPATTSIQVGVKTSTHFLVHDLGFSLVAPDGTEVLLKSPQLDCVGPYLASVNVSFTTDPAYTDTIDYCTAPGNITGTYAATGDWSLLDGMDPSNGAWQVRIYDAENANGDSHDGYLTSATLVFTDLDINGDTAVISYNSGAISEEILNPISSELRATSYILPIRLMTSCWNSEDARAIVTVTGGIPPYTYAWSGPTSVPNSKDVLLGHGTYTVTVTDAMGCTTQATVEVTSPAPITYDSFSATDTLSCHGAADGIIRVKASGGTGPLTYILLPNIPSSVADSGVFTGLKAGTYTLHISDINDCSLDTTFSITEPDAFVLQGVTVDSLLCSGDTDGSILVLAQGGKTPYTYRITPGTEINNDGLFENLSQGNYVVRVTDAGTCGDTLVTDTVRMNAPSPLLIDSLTVDPILCNGGSGSITLHVSGGSLPYEGSVDGGVVFTPALTFGDLAPGNYTPAVRDGNACIAVYPTSVTLIDPPPITIDSISLTGVSGCYGDATGSIYIAASGGWNQIEYSLDGLNYQSDNLFGSVTGGPKTLYIRDSLGCIVTIDTLEIEQPEQLTVSVAVTQAIGSTPGTITLTASGGTPPYVYSIDNGINTQDTGYFGDLVPALYDVFVQDAHGCIFTDTVRIILNELNVLITQQDVSCYGLSDGEFIITVQNGVPPYRMTGDFLGTDTITSTDGLFPFIRIAAGSYSFTIEDAEGRTYSHTVIISEPPEIIITGVITRPACTNNTNDGSVILTVTGGNPDYVYTWSNGATTKDLLNISEDLFTVTVEDENLCSDSAQFDVVALNDATASAGLDDTLCYGAPYTLNGGDPGYDAVRWEPADLVSDSTLPNPEVILYERTEFIYTVTNNSCWDKDTVILDVFPQIGMDITSSVEYDTAVFLLSGQAVTLEATDGFDHWLWYPSTGLSSDTTRIVECTPDATRKYYVTGTTENGCEETDSISIVIAEQITVIYTGFTPNGDGVNDRWTIPHAGEYGDRIEVQVFNRWGQRLFYSKGYGGSNEWDGTYKGKPVPVATYYYIITLDDGKTEPFTGTVTIIR